MVKFRNIFPKRGMKENKKEREKVVLCLIKVEERNIIPKYYKFCLKQFSCTVAGSDFTDKAGLNSGRVL